MADGAPVAMSALGLLLSLHNSHAHVHADKAC
jgi:hypothetical protein